jgi:ATP-dependent DNA helicase RecG
MTPKKLLQLLRLGENSQVEFKTDLQAVDSIGKHVCAFLNSAGGYIVCGVSDKGQITGVDITDARLLTFEKNFMTCCRPRHWYQSSASR